MVIVRKGGQFEVQSKSGRRLGTHSSRSAAVDQLQAIEASKARRLGKVKRHNKKVGKR